MSRTKRIIALLLVLAIVGGLVAGVAVWTRNNDPSNPPAGLYVKNKLVKEPGTIMQVDGHDVSYGEYRFFYLNGKAMKEQQMGAGAEIWEAPGLEDELKKEVEASIKGLYAWAAYATANGISITEEEKADMQTQLEQGIEQYAAGDKEVYLKQANLIDEETHFKISELYMLANKANEKNEEAMFEENKEALLADVITAKHILVKFPEDTSEVASSTAEDTEDVAAGKAETLTRAEKILEEIRASEDQAAAFEERYSLSEDPGSISSPEGYTFTEGVMVGAFYEGAKALKVGEISELVESNSGYHIILRLPIDEEVVKTNLNAQSGSVPVAAQVWAELYNSKMKEMTDAATVVEGEYYSQINVKNVR